MSIYQDNEIELPNNINFKLDDMYHKNKILIKNNFLITNNESLQNYKINNY